MAMLNNQRVHPSKSHIYIHIYDYICIYTPVSVKPSELPGETPINPPSHHRRRQNLDIGPPQFPRPEDVRNVPLWKSTGFPEMIWVFTGWCPPVISWFINPILTIVISAINHSYGSYKPT